MAPHVHQNVRSVWPGPPQKHNILIKKPFGQQDQYVCSACAGSAGGFALRVQIEMPIEMKVNNLWPDGEQVKETARSLGKVAWSVCVNGADRVKSIIDFEEIIKP